MTKSSKKIYKRADTFLKKAQSYGYRSRSSLKLLEIQKRDKFIQAGSRVVDLGCSPGGWSQVTKQIIGKKGKVLGIDIKKMEPIQGVNFIQKSIGKLTSRDFEEENIFSPFDIVLSDIAPNISGIRYRDDSLMIELLSKIQLFIDNNLIVDGSSLIKVFQGESLDMMMIYMKSNFQKVRIRKPDSSRTNSKETYILGLNKKT